VVRREKIACKKIGKGKKKKKKEEKFPTRTCRLVQKKVRGVKAGGGGPEAQSSFS